jgi:hypothetical protein
MEEQHDLIGWDSRVRFRLLNGMESMMCSLDEL